MKRFKQLRNEISELSEEHSEGGGFGYDETLKSKGRSAIPEVRPVNYEDDSDLGKINAFIQKFCSNTYLDPKSALYLLRAKLNLAGVDFDVSRATDIQLDQEYSFPVKRFGGTFGTSPQHDLKAGFEVTDGFGDRHFVLKCKVTSASAAKGRKQGLYTIDAFITEA